MSGIKFLSSGGGAIPNINRTVERLGAVDDIGTGATITTGTAHVKGSWVQIGTTVSAWAGFEVVMSFSATGRCLYDLATDSGGTNLLTPAGGLYVESQSGSQPHRDFLPLNVAAGTQIWMRAQHLSASVVITATLRGNVRDAGSRPLFSTMTALTTVDTAGTKGSGTDISLRATGSTTFDTVVASLATSYDALMVRFSYGTSTPVTSQIANYRLATGAAASEVEVGGLVMRIANSTAIAGRAASLLIETSFAAGLRISSQFKVATPGSDVIRIQLTGFKA